MKIMPIAKLKDQTHIFAANAVEMLISGSSAKKNSASINSFDRIVSA
jgi:hypothetical protein